MRWEPLPIQRTGQLVLVYARLLTGRQSHFGIIRQPGFLEADPGHAATPRNLRAPQLDNHGSSLSDLIVHDARSLLTLAEPGGHGSLQSDHVDGQTRTPFWLRPRDSCFPPVVQEDGGPSINVLFTTTQNGRGCIKVTQMVEMLGPRFCFASPHLSRSDVSASHISLSSNTHTFLSVVEPRMSEHLRRCGSKGRLRASSSATFKTPGA